MTATIVGDERGSLVEVHYICVSRVVRGQRPAARRSKTAVRCPNLKMLVPFWS